MLKKSVFLILLILFFIAGVYAQRGTARSETIQIRFASPLPRNSDYGRGLERMAGEWTRVTNGAVNVIMSHDGREGTEQAMVTALSNNTIQAALLSSGGVSEICPPVVTLSIPFLIKNDRELDAVLSEVTPFLNSSVKNEFVIITWSKGGWLYVFSKEPVLTPADLRRQRLASGPELTEMNHAFRTMGFNIIESDMIQTGTRLANNTVNAIYMVPTAVAPMQIHRHVSNMMDLPIGPLMGAIVMNRVTWNRLTREQQQGIVRSAQGVADSFASSIPRAEESAIAAMARSGLSVNKPTSSQEALWKTELNDSVNSLLGTAFDRDLYNQINRILERARSGN